MLNKINKLIYISKNEDDEIYNKLISIAKKIKRKKEKGRNYLLIDIKIKEALSSPDKVEGKDNLGKVELEL